VVFFNSTFLSKLWLLLMRRSRNVCLIIGQPMRFCFFSQLLRDVVRKERFARQKETSFSFSNSSGWMCFPIFIQYCTWMTICIVCIAGVFLQQPITVEGGLWQSLSHLSVRTKKGGSIKLKSKSSSWLDLLNYCFKKNFSLHNGLAFHNIQFSGERTCQL